MNVIKFIFHGAIFIVISYVVFFSPLSPDLPHARKAFANVIEKLHQLTLPQPLTTLAPVVPKKLDAQEEIFNMMHEAKSALIVGDVHNAVELLQKVVKKDDNVYSAKRLLQLIKFHDLDALEYSDEVTVLTDANAFDLLVRFCRDIKEPVSVDPVVLGELHNTNLGDLSIEVLSSTSKLEDLLENYGFKVINVDLNSTNRAVFVTKVAPWVYTLAVDSLMDNNWDKAFKLLSYCKIDGSEFGNHGQDLVRVLKIIESKKYQLISLELDVAKRLRDYKTGLQIEKTGAAAASSAITSRGKQSGRMYKKQGINYQKDSIYSLDVTLELFENEILEAYTEVYQRVVTAMQSDLNTEALFLLQHMKRYYVRYRKIIRNIKETLPQSRLIDPGGIPAFIIESERRLIASIELSDNHVNASEKLITTSPVLANSKMSMALSTDRCNPRARIGRGYGILRQHADSLNHLEEIISKKPSSETLRSQIATYRKERRYGMLAALSGNAVPIPVKTKIGSVKGLVTSGTKGEIFPLIVQIREIKPNSSRSFKKNTFWGNILSRRFTEDLYKYPILFGDYGEKDFLAILSAVEAYKWMTTVAPDTFNENKKNRYTGLYINFHWWGNKGGDSAGTTIGIAAYSAHNNVGVRQDVAMTGSIRMDGGVKAVGGVPLKIQGAYEADQVELVLVPRENEEDLAAVPINQLMKLIIVTADDIQTYMNYSLKE